MLYDEKVVTILYSTFEKLILALQDQKLIILLISQKTSGFHTHKN